MLLGTHAILSTVTDQGFFPLEHFSVARRSNFARFEVDPAQQMTLIYIEAYQICGQVHAVILNTTEIQVPSNNFLAVICNENQRN